MAWAVDPYLGELFPELWNYYISSATPNDTFLAGVDGAGYVYGAFQQWEGLTWVFVGGWVDGCVWGGGDWG